MPTQQCPQFISTSSEFDISGYYDLPFLFIVFCATFVVYMIAVSGDWKCRPSKYLTLVAVASGVIYAIGKYNTLLSYVTFGAIVTMLMPLMFGSYFETISANLISISFITVCTALIIYYNPNYTECYDNLGQHLTGRSHAIIIIFTIFFFLQVFFFILVRGGLDILVQGNIGTISRIAREKSAIKNKLNSLIMKRSTKIMKTIALLIACVLLLFVFGYIYGNTLLDFDGDG